MEADALRQLLQQLHGELEDGQSVDDKTRDLLRTVLSDINDVLDKEPRPDAAGGEHHTLIERLKESTWHLEESHPRLTTAVSDLVDGLTAIFR